MLVRAVGPGLAQYGVGDLLPDPKLTIIPLGKSFTVASNNDWGDGGQTAALQTAFAAVRAFSLDVGSKDAALSVRLPPGGYPVQVSGAGTTTGTVLVEVYNLDL